MPWSRRELEKFDCVHTEERVDEFGILCGCRSLKMSDEMNARYLRDRSIEHLGAPELRALPLIEWVQLRSLDEIADRSYALTAVIASANGFDKATALSWLGENDVELLNGPERKFLRASPGSNRFDENAGVETLSILMWAVGRVGSVGVMESVPYNLVELSPDILRNQKIADFKLRSKILAKDRVLTILDRYVCFYWLECRRSGDGEKAKRPLR